MQVRWQPKYNAYLCDECNEAIFYSEDVMNKYGNIIDNDFDNDEQTNQSSPALSVRTIE